MNPLFVTGFIFVSTTTVPHNYIRQFSPSLALQLMSNSTSLVVWGQILQPNRWARNYSTLTTERPSVDNFQLDPDWVTGFVDGEGCFTVSITEYKKYKLGLKVEHRFIICLHVKDQAILEGIKKSLGVGKIYKSGPQSIQYVVTSIKELERVINHFDQYPLITKKRGDFYLLKKVFILIKNKEHLTPEGLRKIVALRASMNLGLSDKLKVAFPDVVPVVRPVVSNPTTIDANWLAGFTSAEGLFMVKITASLTNSVGFQFQLVLEIAQHLRDHILLVSFISFFNAGSVIKYKNASFYRVTKFDDIVNKIIPFFKKYPILGVKALDFADFCKAAELMKNKAHLTKDGLEKIRKIKAGMNRGRKFN